MGDKAGTGRKYLHREAHHGERQDAANGGVGARAWSFSERYCLPPAHGVGRRTNHQYALHPPGGQEGVVNGRTRDHRKQRRHRQAAQPIAGREAGGAGDPFLPARRRRNECRFQERCLGRSFVVPEIQGRHLPGRLRSSGERRSAPAGLYGAARAQGAARTTGAGKAKGGRLSRGSAL
ncbi:hypothetical protein D9M69_564650 [compost metagenome]